MSILQYIYVCYSFINSGNRTRKNPSNQMSIQDYQLLSKLGSGSFGVVHKARDKKNNTICVVKIVDVSNMNTKLRKNAMEQGKILKQANSPFIVKHFNTFINKSTLYIVMEYCPKGDLTSYMKSQMGKPLKQETIWKFSIQMLAGLRDLHAKKILHRDIKSLNVFLDENYNAKIGDLGVAKTMTAQFAHTIVGTPYYLSPEMCEQKPYNEKTDIWAMGCVIYELCAGKRPFEANNQAALALKIVMGKYESLPSHYSSDLVWIVKSCLSVDYKRRPTAAYLLGMSKTKQMALKLNIPIDGSQIREQNKEIKAQQKQIIKKQEQMQVIKKQQEKQVIKKQVEVQKNQKVTPNQVEKNKAKQKQKQSNEIINVNANVNVKVSRDGQKNVKQVLNNKVIVEPKPVKYSGAKRMEMMSKDIKEQQDKQKQKQKQREQQKQKQQKQKQKQKQLQKQRQLQRQKQQKQRQQKQQNQQPKGSPTKQPQKISPNRNEHEYRSQPSSFNREKDRKQQLMSTTTNRFLPENYKKRKEIDLQDESKIQEVHLIDSDSSSEQQAKNKNNDKKQKGTDKKDVFLTAQQVVDDDQLMKQFGMQKKENKIQPKVGQGGNKFSLDKKPISIDWNNLSNKNEEINKSSLLKQLPTVKTKSSKQLEILQQLQINEQQGQSQKVQEDINENRAYISSQEDQGEAENSEVVEQQQFLIEDTDQKQQDLNTKHQENKKRKEELERMKKYFQPQLIKHMSEKQYERLKEKVIDCNGDEVEGFVEGWKGNIQAMNLFYRIVHFQIEIRRCEANLKNISIKLEDIKKNKG